MKALMLVLLVFLLSCPSIILADVTDGLVAYYSFNDCSAFDSSGNGYHGAIQGSPLCVAGIQGKALQFDGVNEAVTLPTSVIGQWSQLTYSVWAKADPYSGNAWPTFIASYSSNNFSRNNAIGILQNTGKMWAEVDTTVGDFELPGALPIPWNVWFHAALVYDGSTLTEYLNGQQGNSMPASGTLNPVMAVSMAQSPGVSFDAFAGALDEVRIYNRALTQAEIVELFNLPPPQPDINTRVKRLEDAMSELISKMSTFEGRIANHSHSYLTGKGAGQNDVKEGTGPAIFPALPEPVPYE